jgi:7-cyano-7-deazaguanine reductase
MTDTSPGSADASPLGRVATYACHYAPELLFPIARQEKRAELGIRPSALPFAGFDLWNAYELSWLNPRGKPVAALGRFRFPADTPRLVESKSLKLYLNSFNQSHFSGTGEVVAAIARDLSLAAGGQVAVAIETLDSRPERSLGYPEGSLLDTLDIAAEQYSPAPALLSADGPEVSETLYSHLLKSNCLVTGQPDWAMVVVRYIGPAMDREGLLKYFISFRQHNEFHEQCVERIFCDLMARCRPKSLAVWARYTRRGGLDINPFRTTGDLPEPDNTGEVRQ